MPRCRVTVSVQIPRLFSSTPPLPPKRERWPVSVAPRDSELADALDPVAPPLHFKRLVSGTRRISFRGWLHRRRLVTRGGNRCGGDLHWFNSGGFPGGRHVG